MATSQPALIVTFAREEGLERLIGAGIDAGVQRFYIAIDGPRTDEHRSSQLKMHNFLNGLLEVPNLQINIWQRSENLGPAVSVFTAINWFFTQEDSGYILEDDLVLSPDFFTFANSALNFYGNNPDVWVVAGSRMNPPISNSSNSDWSHYPMIWGWATWAKKWERMSSLLMGQDELPLKEFFNARLNFWQTGARRAQRGIVDAWDIPLANAQFKNNKYTVIPPVNLVTNVGFDSVATHTSGSIFPLNHPIDSLPNDFQLSPFAIDSQAKSYDRILEKKLFKIKFHHALLGIYGPILDFYKLRRRPRTPLSDRTKRVIPPR